MLKPRAACCPQTGLNGVLVPVLLPGVKRTFVPLTPQLSSEDRKVVDNLSKVVNFLTRGSGEQGGASGSSGSSALVPSDPNLLRELLPVLPNVAQELLPQLTGKLVNRVAARVVRELYT